MVWWKDPVWIGVLITAVGLLVAIIIGRKQLASFFGPMWANRPLRRRTPEPPDPEAPIAVRWENKGPKRESESIGLDLIVTYCGPLDEDIEVSFKPTAELLVETTQAGLRVAGSDMPATKVQGNTGGWRTNRLGRYHKSGDRGFIEFPIRGTARHIVDHPGHREVVIAKVEWSTSDRRSGTEHAERVLHE